VKPAAVRLPAILSLGSNLGDREATLRQAVAAIAATPGVSVVRASGLVETPALTPHGIDPNAPAYLNAAVLVSTTLTPHALLDALADIEQRHGRVRTERWGNRTLDIDIVTMGGLRIDTERLTIPHPRAGERAFVLAPWLELQPDAELPGRGRVADLLAAAGDPPAPYLAEALA
jgi:2-amino-4-hydroxy-6-hydroxymethyldihydropteridine diphosphokinase